MVMFGNICFRTWYPSYYGKDVLGDAASASGATGKTHKKGEQRDAEPLLDRLYVCPCCFKYSKEIVQWWGHVRVCESKNVVPGRKIYVHPKGRAVPAPEVAGKGTKRRRGEAGAVVQSVEDEGEWSIWEVDGAKDGVSLFLLIQLHPLLRKPRFELTL